MDKTSVHDPEAIRSFDIVTADDARAQLWLLRTYLSSAGHRIRAANNGKEAFRLAACSPPDLLITDLEMPVCSGFDLIRAIREADDLRLRKIPHYRL